MAAFRDPAGPVGLTGLVSSGRKPAIGADIDGAAEPCRIVDSGDEAERDDGADAKDGCQAPCIELSLAICWISASISVA